MKGMIFAAGRGTRLAPLTESIPKALVDVNGRPMLEHVAERMIEAGVDELVVNVHHLGDKVIRFLEEKENFGITLHVSDERNCLLDTGGGLAAAGGWLRGDAPFLLHNVDILCDVDLRSIVENAVETDALAVLAVQERETSRHLLFDDAGLLGHGNIATGQERRVRESVGSVRRLGFCGIHAISPRIFPLIEEEGAFSIVPLYMRLASEGHPILPLSIDEARWIDIGTHERLSVANAIW